jgi:hypothetical protein
MAEEIKPNPELETAKETKPEAKPATVKTEGEAKPAAAKKVKEPAIEDKPFGEFIEQHFQPALKTALADRGIDDINLKFTKSSLPLTGANPSETCWQMSGSWLQGERQFNIYFLEENISGKKAFSYSTNGLKPSTIESFAIDERKVTLDLLVLYTLQRLNGQKWLMRN